MVEAFNERQCTQSSSWQWAGEIVDILVHSKFDMLPYLETAIEAAADRGHPTIVDNLLEYRRRKQPRDDEKPSTATVGPPFPNNSLFPVCLAVTG